MGCFVIRFGTYKDKGILDFQVFLKFRKKLKSTEASVKHSLSRSLKKKNASRPLGNPGFPFCTSKVPLINCYAKGFPPKWHWCLPFFFEIPLTSINIYKQSRKLYGDRTECLIKVQPSKPGLLQVPPQTPQPPGKVGTLSFFSSSFHHPPCELTWRDKQCPLL